MDVSKVPSSDPALIWLRPERPRHQARPFLSREEITRAAIRLADAEGLERVTIRRIASSLGAGANSLYWYIDSKDDLFELMADEVVGGRSRGDSTDNADHGDYTVEREIEDLAAVIEKLGGSAGLFGHSSGGLLALEAVLHGLPISKVGVYEPSYIPGSTRPQPPADLLDRLKELINNGDNDAAAALFLQEQVGVPAPIVNDMRTGPAWAFLSGLAHTLPYDVALSSPDRLGASRLATINIPTLAINGDQTEDWLQAATHAIADTIPGARHDVLAGQDHAVLHNPDALRQPLTDFFNDAR